MTDSGSWSRPAPPRAKSRRRHRCRQCADTASGTPCRGSHRPHSADNRRRRNRPGTSSTRKGPTAGYFSFSWSRDLIYSTYSISTLKEQSFPFSSRMSMPPPYIAIGAFLCMRIFLSSDPARTCMIRSASFGQWLRSSTSLG